MSCNYCSKTLCRITMFISFCFVVTYGYVELLCLSIFVLVLHMVNTYCCSMVSSMLCYILLYLLYLPTLNAAVVAADAFFGSLLSGLILRAYDFTHIFFCFIYYRKYV